MEKQAEFKFGGGSLSFVLTIIFFFQRSAKLIPEDDQIFTEVELNVLEKVINETMVGGKCVKVAVITILKTPVVD